MAKNPIRAETPSNGKYMADTSMTHAATGEGSPIHIALTFDDKFWAPSYATMRGICATTGRRKDIVFHLVHTGLGATHKAKLETITDECGARLVFYDVAASGALESRIANFPRIRHKNLNEIVYARLFLCHIIPADVKRLIYIDSDILVRIAIESFFDIDLEDKAIAAAISTHRVMFQSHRDLVKKDYFRTEDPYFNAGFLLIDTTKFRAVDFAAVVAQKVPEDQRTNLYYDQDILNIAFNGQVKLLDATWNLQNPIPAHESLDPKIVHYTGNRKPWRLLASPAFKRLYRHTMTNAVYYQFMRERLARRVKRLLRLKG